MHKSDHVTPQFDATSILQRAACIEFLYWRHVSFRAYRKTHEDETPTCGWKGQKWRHHVQRQPSERTNYRKQWLVANGTVIVLRDLFPAITQDRSMCVCLSQPTANRQQQCARKHNRKHVVTLQQLHQLSLPSKRSSKRDSSLNPCSQTRWRYITTCLNSNLRRPCQLTAYRRLSFDAVCIKLCSSKKCLLIT